MCKSTGAYWLGIERYDTAVVEYPSPGFQILGELYARQDDPLDTSVARNTQLNPGLPYGGSGNPGF
jgi:hypothetical protein